MTQIALTDPQYEFVSSNAKECLFLAGIASGKSTALGDFIVRMAGEYPNIPGLITANTYTQLCNATIPAIQKELDRCGLPNEAILSGPKKRLEFGNTFAYLYSLERPDNIRGIEAGWHGSDEIAFASKKEEAIKICKGRLRYPGSPRFERFTTSPNGYDMLYDKFENMDGSSATDKIHLVRGRTCDNTFLPPGYFEELLDDYGGPDNPLARQELFGEFVNLQAGQVYWAFNRDIHVQPVSYFPGYPIYVGQDFNIDNMCSCLIQYVNGIFYVIDEIILDQYGANTDNAAEQILKKTDGYSALVIPDSTGKSRKTSAKGRTDIEILERAGLRVLPTKNPFIRDRQNNCNLKFKKGRLVIGSNCKHLIKEIGTLSARDKEGDKAHVSVGMGYVLNKVNPMIERRASSQHSI